MSMDLVVVRPFGAHGIGDRITDGATIAAILGTENQTNVVQVAPRSGEAAPLVTPTPTKGS